MRAGYPRIRDLPEVERNPFDNWLQGQTCPVEDCSLPMEDWDWYYPCDYTRWKKGLLIID